MLFKYKAIFFDAGGTLVYPYPSVGEIYREAASRYGLEVESATLEKLFRQAWLKRDGLQDLKSYSNEKIEKDFWRDIVKEVFDAVGGVKDFDAFFDELFHAFAEPSTWRLFPEVMDVLKNLQQRNVYLGIISNWDSRLMHLCEGLGVSGFFEHIHISAVFGASKPHPSIFQEALSQAQVEPAHAVHIGDSFEDDIRGAQGVGMDAILIDRHGHQAKANSSLFEQVSAVQSLSQLIG